MSKQDDFIDNAVVSYDGWKPIPGDGREEVRASRAKIKSGEIALVRTRLASSAAGHVQRAADKLLASPNDKLSDSAYAAFHRSVTHAVRLSRLDRELAELEDRFQTAASVTREPGPYDEGSPNSWFRDLLTAGSVQSAWSPHDSRATGAQERLAHHGRDVAGAITKRSDYGQRAVSIIRENGRVEDVVENERRAREEVRNFTAGGGATATAASGAAAFVPPAFVLRQWAEYRSPYRAFADQCAAQPLPPFGLEVFFPQVTAGTTVSTQTEGQAVSEGDPTVGFISSPVVNKAGQLTVSQQFLDRVGPGVTGDVVIITQLTEQLDAQVDAYALSQALSGAQTVTDNSSFALTGSSGVLGFYGDLKKAKALLADTAGTRLRGTHVFSTSDFADYLAGWADAQGRPLITPALGAQPWSMLVAEGDQRGEGWTGYVLTGLGHFADDNIPTLGTTGQTQVIVARPSTILLWEGEPIPYVLPEQFAANLEATVGVRCYVASVPRFPSGVAVVTGTAYAASNFS